MGSSSRLSAPCAHDASGSTSLKEFIPFPGLTTGNPVPAGQIRRNIKSSLARDLPEFEVGDVHANPIALIGGGPSLKDHFADLWALKLQGVKILACGSSHDFLISRRLVPDVAVFLDPLPEMTAYLTNPHPDVLYLVASQCDPSLFDRLDGFRVVRWHADAKVKNSGIPKDRPMIGGGCTVFLRSIILGANAGYRSFHLFGFDGSDSVEGEHHAYEKAPDSAPLDGEPEVYRFGSPDGPEHIVRGSLIAQYYSFLKMMRDPTGPGSKVRMCDILDFTYYGGGLMGEHFKRFPAGA